MTTHSQLVDAIIRETHRPDLLSDISDYLNQTVRELHFTPEKGNAIFYQENLRESQLTANLEEGFVWQIPYPALFQGMQAVRYDSLFARDNKPVYSRELLPGRAMSNHEHYHYRAGDTYAFSGYGGLNSNISIAYYEYPRRLRYRVEAERLVQWDDDLGWVSYHADWDDTDELMLDARNLSSNWILVRWRDVVAEGLRAKVYKRLSDDGRARTSYSLYSQLRQGLFTSEISSGGSLT